MAENDVEAAWADVTARWDDDAAHRAFLDAFGDLEGLAEVGRRYRAVLDARPGDAVASRWRDEAVKRATVLGFAQLPRTQPPATWGLPRWLRSLLIAMGMAFIAGLALALVRSLKHALGWGGH